VKGGASNRWTSSRGGSHRPALARRLHAAIEAKERVPSAGRRVLARSRCKTGGAVPADLRHDRTRPRSPRVSRMLRDRGGDHPHQSPGDSRGPARRGFPAKAAKERPWRTRSGGYTRAGSRCWWARPAWRIRAVGAAAGRDTACGVERPQRRAEAEIVARPASGAQSPSRPTWPAAVWTFAWATGWPSWRALRDRHQPPRKPAHRPPASRARRPPGRPRPLALLISLETTCWCASASPTGAWVTTPRDSAQGGGPEPEIRTFLAKYEGVVEGERQHIQARRQAILESEGPEWSGGSRSPHGRLWSEFLAAWRVALGCSGTRGAAAIRCTNTSRGWTHVPRVGRTDPSGDRRTVREGAIGRAGPPHGRYLDVSHHGPPVRRPHGALHEGRDADAAGRR